MTVSEARPCSTFHDRLDDARRRARPQRKSLGELHELRAMCVERLRRHRSVSHGVNHGCEIVRKSRPNCCRKIGSSARTVPICWDGGYTANRRFGLFYPATGAQACSDIIQEIVNAAQ